MIVCFLSAVCANVTVEMRNVAVALFSSVAPVHSVQGSIPPHGPIVSVSSPPRHPRRGLWIYCPRPCPCPRPYRCRCPCPSLTVSLGGGVRSDSEGNVDCLMDKKEYSQVNLRITCWASCSHSS
jgi:hypothetical protein